MSFYGKPDEPDEPVQPTPMRKFAYLGRSEIKEFEIEAHDVFFYESGHVGFWNNKPDGDRYLVLAVKTLSIREISA